MYTHRVQYYETDKMGITHHSNYIRWMEEARIDFLAQRGYDYDKLEAIGIISPVVSVNCHYRKATTFNELVNIDASIVEFNGIKLRLNYKMYVNDSLVCESESLHCFVNKEGRPIRLKKDYPDFYDMLDKSKVEQAEEI